MSENVNSQVQQAQTMWTKMMGESATRMEGALTEAARIETMTADHAKTAIDEFAKLSRDGLAYYGQLSAEWRKLTLEAMRRATELATWKA